MATSFTLPQRIDGELKPAPDEDWQAYMRKSQLEAMMAMARTLTPLSAPAHHST